MVTILLKKIIDVLTSSFTSIKSKLTYMYNHIQPPTPPTPPTPAVSLAQLVNEGVLCSNGSFQNVTITNYKQYTYLYLWIYESEKSYKFYSPNSYCACFKSNEIGTGIRDILWLGYFRNSTTERFSFSISGDDLIITPTDIYNKPNVWINVYASNDQIFNALLEG